MAHVFYERPVYSLTYALTQKVKNMWNFIHDRGEWGHRVTFYKIGSSAHIFNSWCLILSWYIPYSKSFKNPHWCSGCIAIGFDARVGYASMMVMRRSDRTCHIYGSVCHLQGHIMSVMVHILFNHRMPSSIPGMFHFSVFLSYSYDL